MEAVKSSTAEKSVEEKEQYDISRTFTDFRVEPDACRSRRLHILIDRASLASIKLLDNESIFRE